MKWLSRIPIFKKLLLSSILMLVLACFTVSFYLIWNTNKLLLEVSSSQAQQEMEQLINSYSSTLERQYNTILQLADYQPLNTFLENDYTSTYEKYIDFTSTVFPWLNWLRNSEKTIYMKIYMDDGYESIASLTGGKISQLMNTGWYGTSGGSSSGVTIAYANTLVNTTYENAIIYYQNIWNAQHTQIKRVISVAQSVAQLQKSIMVQDANYYLISPTGQIVSTNNNRMQGLQLDDAMADIGLQAEQLINQSIMKTEGIQYYVLTADFHPDAAGLQQGWKIICLKNYNNVVDDIRNQVFKIVQICLLIVLVALVFAGAVSFNITARLKLLIKKINSLAKGNFTVNISIPGKDEISQISNNFDEMSKQIFSLMETHQKDYQNMLEYERRQKDLLLNMRDLQYQALRAQINPHYLFNTLESLRMNLLVDGQKETARIMQIFGETIREYMDIDRIFSTLREELRFIDYYIETQKFRMGDRIKYKTDIPESLLELQIPRLILQPIVENAINHGIDLKVEGGTILLSAHRKDDILIITVRDDGAGMSKAKLEQLNASLAQYTDSGDHLGLRSVHHRLRLLFEQAGGIHVESTEGIGTIITMKMTVQSD